ncbi:aspartate/glutamate racemase family protein [Paraburkholderia sp. BR10882]|uniref:aspartate/glutamate racemase family protein n=1 Tax=unclassified Paraburkholderia TaxID=2615204 RepID=UPI0034D00929
MSQSIVFPKPNGLGDVTRETEKTVRALRVEQGAPAAFETLHTVPGGIETQRIAYHAVAVTDYVARHAADAVAFVIAFYSDPGLHAREVTKKPVITIGAAAMGVALARALRIGVIAASSRGMPRHLHSYRAVRSGNLIAGAQAVNLGADESGDRDLARDEFASTGRALRVEDGADVVVLGCGDMTPLRADNEAAPGVPVIDPCWTAASLAVSVCRERGIK